ncbi:MAG TPA: cytochrome c [Chthoniobacteraceae bacterium]|nr:cytochrome c [Chthoniobacteraceae bacterium]
MLTPVHRSLLAAVTIGSLFLPGCRRGMEVDGRIKPLQESRFFPDGASARQPPEQTVARGELDADTFFHQGEVDGRLVASFPGPVTLAVLKRGRERFDIYCAVCHGRTGEGDGMVVQRGFPAPPSYHQKRLREAPVGYLYGVITRGYGVMYSYADRVTPEDRWAIVAYIRALQISQDARLDDVPPQQRKELLPP